MKMPKITIRKFNGDDSCSWAVFQNNAVIWGLTGLNLSQARYYRDQVKKELAKKESEKDG